MPRKSRDIMEKRWIAMPAVLSFLVVAHARVDATAVTYDFTLIAADGGPLTAFNSNIYPAVNGAGAVAFQAWTSAGVEGIFGGGGGNVTTIASNAAGTPFDFFGPGLAAGPLIDGDGDVAFKAYLKAGGQGIFLSESFQFDFLALDQRQWNGRVRRIPGRQHWNFHRQRWPDHDLRRQLGSLSGVRLPVNQL